MGEVDPGENTEKIKRGIRRGPGQDHRYDWEGSILRLTYKG